MTLSSLFLRLQGSGRIGVAAGAIRGTPPTFSVARRGLRGGPGEGSGPLRSAWSLFGFQVAGQRGAAGEIGTYSEHLSGSRAGGEAKARPFGQAPAPALSSGDAGDAEGRFAGSAKELGSDTISKIFIMSPYKNGV